MSGRDDIIASKKGDSGLVQARFGAGMLLHHDDLERLGAFPRELSRLLFRSFFGCGVVCGLRVDEPKLKCGKLWITVNPGLALDCSGDPIYVPTAQTVAVDESCETDGLEGTYYVVLCPTTKCCAPRAASCGGDEEEPSLVCTQERYGFEIRVLRDWPECACGCRRPEESLQQATTAAGGGAPPVSAECRCVDCSNPCHADHYGGKCGCSCDDCSDCDCNCVVLACVHPSDNGPSLGVAAGWTADHGCRRFIRPVRMCDPEVKRHKDQAANNRGTADVASRYSATASSTASARSTVVAKAPAAKKAPSPARRPAAPPAPATARVGKRGKPPAMRKPRGARDGNDPRG